MTMTMTSSQFGLEDMEALLWGPSSPTADAMGSLFYHPDQEENQEGGGTSPEGDTSPVSPLTSLSLPSPPNFYSPPSSPPAVLLHGDKAGNESALLSLPWLEHPDQLGCQMISDDRTEDPLGALDWMAEKMDLNEFDLDSLIGSCSPHESSISSTEDLLASLDCPMELDSFPEPTLSTPVLSSLPSASPPTTLPTVCEDASLITVEVSDSCFAPSPPPCVPEPQEELEIKSEPASPDPPMVDSPSSPVDTLDLGSEVDVLETEEKPVLAAVVPQVQRIVFSLTPTRIVLVLAPKNEVGVTTSTVTTTPGVAHSSPSTSHPQRSSRSRPYPEPKSITSPPSPSIPTVKVKSLCDDDDDEDDDERVTLKMPKDKKLKKMAQNKTAATRYRQKKRCEQDSISSEHSILERKNMELREKAESMAREIEYLKELMEEVRSGRTRKGLSADP